MDIFLWMNYSFLKSDVFDLWLASAFRKDDFPKNPRFVDKFFFIRVYIHWYALVRKVVQNYAWIALIGTGGMIVSAVIGLCLYGKKRVAI